MTKIFNIKDFLDYTRITGFKNNYIHLVEYDKQKNIRKTSEKIELDFYLLAIKVNYDKQKYFGQTSLDHSNSFIFLDQPGDFLQWNLEETISGYHLLIDKNLFKKIASQYSFIHYKNHEALFITKDEEYIITDLFKKALEEFENNDEYLENIILSYASLILSYIQKFYNRQFHTRKEIYNSTVTDFYKNLETYYSNSKASQKMPSVSYFADKANLSANYFGDLIKYYTGQSPQQHINSLLIQTAKNKLNNTLLTISEIAFSLGFEYPSYFTIFFKKETGISPNHYRNQ